MTSIIDQLQQARTELQQNSRLRVGVWTILLIGLTYLLLVQSDRMTLANLDYEGQREQLEKAKSLKTGTGWADQLATQKRLADELSGAFWEADTQGLAQASLQAELNEMIAGLEIRKGRIRSGVMQPLADMPGGFSSPSEQFANFQADAPSCDRCGAITVRNGNCYLCHNCGNSMGCS